MEPGFPELSIGIDEQSDIERIVDDLVLEGATFLKSYEMLSRPTYLKLLKIAQERGLRVTGHIPLSIDLLEAIEAGLGGMQHIRNLDLACALDADETIIERQHLLDNKEELAGSALRSKIHKSQRYAAIANFDKKRCNTIIRKLAKYEVFQTPTLTINSYGSKRLLQIHNGEIPTNSFQVRYEKTGKQILSLKLRKPLVKMLQSLMIEYEDC